MTEFAIGQQFLATKTEQGLVAGRH